MLGTAGAADTNDEHTCFQTGQAFSSRGALGADVAICYGIDAGLPARIQSWRDHGYRIQVMTGVAWGHYQDYVEGRFDGVDHRDEAQTDRAGRPHRHGDSPDIFYMCPGTNYGKYLCVGVQRALDAGAEAIHLEEPEYWVGDGYEAGFRREWRQHFGEDWQPPHSSPDAQWRASQLKYFLYRRALQQVFDYVHAYNERTGRHVRCLVPTHSLLNYAHWRIVSPEASLAALTGCDGYIAQVWTGTARTPNLYRGVLRERTFETAFLEYGAMQSLVRATGGEVWYLNDPIEDNPGHSWEDYRVNWESTLVASLLEPEVARFEIAPWPERVFGGRYPARSSAATPIPPAYATELQTVMNALNDLDQPRTAWEAGTPGMGLLVSDSLMFERGGAQASEEHLSGVYGLALPFLKHGMPLHPVQMEHLGRSNTLGGFRLLLLSYHGMKPLTPAAHGVLADWVRAGGMLVVCDDDSDPYNAVREWWNQGSRTYATPRAHLFEALGLAANPPDQPPGGYPVGRGRVGWVRENPAQIAQDPAGAGRLRGAVQSVAEAAGLAWRETNCLVLRRGPYIVAAGLDESVPSQPRALTGRFVNLFDPELRLRDRFELTPGSRAFLLDLNVAASPAAPGPRLLAAAARTRSVPGPTGTLRYTCEGVGDTAGIALFHCPQPPHSVTMDGVAISDNEYSATERTLRVHWRNEARRRTLAVGF